MKTVKIRKTVFILISGLLVLFTLKSMSQCTNCIGSTTSNDGSAVGFQTIATGDYSFATGYQSEATGNISTAIGYKVKSQSTRSFSLGFYAESKNANSYAIGNYVTASSPYNFVIGSGIGSDTTERLVNNLTKSLMVGFYSDRPTFFVGQSNGAGTTGKIGIGDVTEPQAKLHIKGDIGEDADLLLEPVGNGNYARLKFGTSGNVIDALQNHYLNFRTNSGFVFWDGNVGIGSDNPQAKLQVADGDIFIEDIDRGIIMKSPDGQCWRGTLDNNGTLNFTAIDCGNLTAVKENSTGDETTFKVYPNPAKNSITIELKGKNKAVDVNIFDNMGNLVVSRKMNSEKLKIKTGNFPAGNYIVTVSDKRGMMINTTKITLL